MFGCGRGVAARSCSRSGEVGAGAKARSTTAKLHSRLTNLGHNAVAMQRHGQGPYDGCGRGVIGQSTQCSGSETIAVDVDWDGGRGQNPTPATAGTVGGKGAREDRRGVGTGGGWVYGQGPTGATRAGHVISKSGKTPNLGSIDSLHYPEPSSVLGFRS